MLLGYLCGNNVTSSFHDSLFNLMGHDLSHDQRLGHKAKVRSGPLQLPDGRNKLCRQTLESGAEWLFMLDADMGFEPDLLDRLLDVADARERPVVGGLCFSMRELMPDGMGGMHTFPAPTILNWVEMADGVSRFVGQDHYPVNTMIQVGATGGACLLVHRSVLERIGEDWFTQCPTDDGVFQGEDISFCWRLRQLGIPVWIHTGIRLTHMKTVWLGEPDFWQSRVAPPADERVDVIVPVLHRPENVAPLVRSLRASTGMATAFFVCDPDDAEEIATVKAEGAQVLLEPGTFAHKVNVGARLTAQRPAFAPWVLLVGDDVQFRPGWLDQALDVARRYHVDVVGTNDLRNPRTMRGEHATHPLIRRQYIDDVGASWDGPGIVCHEGYGHWYVDDEITTAAKLRHTFQGAMGSFVAHYWHGDDPDPDPVYRKGMETVDADRALWERRLQQALRDAARPRVLEPVG